MPDSPDQPSLRFWYSEALHLKAITLLDALEQAAEPTEHRKALGDLVVELTGAGFDYYFLKPMALVKAGFLSQQSASFGLSSALRIMSPFIRSAIGSMDKNQVVLIARYIRGMMP